MKTETKPATHTPTPWEVIEEEGYVAAYIDGPEPKDVGMISCELNQNGLANASFIVRAVNAHEDLVKALKKAHASFCVNNGTYPCEVEALIAKAEGK